MKIEGSPVYPLITPFKKSGSIDYRSLNNYINYLTNSGVKVIISTVGTSRFNLLDNSEVVEINNKFIEFVNGKSITLCAGPIYGSFEVNKKALQEAINSGGNGYLAIYPERFYSEESIQKFYFDLAEKSSIPIFIHQMSLRSGYGGTVNYSKSLITKLMSHDNILGMKEESQDKNLSNWIHQNYSNNKLIIGQGGMLNFINDYEFGAKSYLVGLGSFLPNIEEQFHKHLLANEKKEAINIKRSYEDEYFKVAVSLGWHVQLKEVLFFMNLMSNYERLPLEPLEKFKSDQLYNFLKNHKLLSLEIEKFKL